MDYDKISAKLKEYHKKVKDDKIAKYDENPKICRCGAIIEFKKRENLYCSRACGNIYRQYKDETRMKISSALVGRGKRITSTCERCSAEIVSHRKRLYCSVQCSNKSRPKRLSEEKRNSLSYYRTICSFNFSVYDYPEEFDLKLLNDHKWYKASNRGNNLYGVSRDHLVSVKYGYDNGIDPKIISHPANCQLLLHSDNVKKGSKNSIELTELLNRIEEWEKRYS